MNEPVTLSVSMTTKEVWNLNDRLTDMALYRHKQAIRQRAVMIYRLNGSPRIDARVRCVCHIDYPDKRERDAGNYAGTAKAAVDGFVHPAGHRGKVRGLLVDDSDRYLVGPDMRHDEDSPPTLGRYTFTFYFEEIDS